MHIEGGAPHNVVKCWWASSKCMLVKVPLSAVCTNHRAWWYAKELTCYWRISRPCSQLDQQHLFKVHCVAGACRAAPTV